MAGSNTKLTEYVNEELKKYKGIMVPVKASFLERILVRKAKCKKLHPNPDDEFCFPDIGPNQEIISKYAENIRTKHCLSSDGVDEPLMVEKIRPDGYMLLNGHHRWAAALQMGFDPVPIEIVNLTQETDVRKMIHDSVHDRRVTLDLDEVVFCDSENDIADEPLGFPANRLYKKPIRLGIPALLHYLSTEEYDIWVYSEKYYSIEYIRGYFKKYSVKVDGIITGSARKSLRILEARKRTDELIRNKYVETIHIDRNTVLRTRRDSKDYDEYPIQADAQGWSMAVVDIIKNMPEG